MVREGLWLAPPQHQCVQGSWGHWFLLWEPQAPLSWATVSVPLMLQGYSPPSDPLRAVRCVSLLDDLNLGDRPLNFYLPLKEGSSFI